VRSEGVEGNSRKREDAENLKLSMLNAQFLVLILPTPYTLHLRLHSLPPTEVSETVTNPIKVDWSDRLGILKSLDRVRRI
jgi:hypothetical protein